LLTKEPPGLQPLNNHLRLCPLLKGRWKTAVLNAEKNMTIVSEYNELSAFTGTTNGKLLILLTSPKGYP